MKNKTNRLKYVSALMIVLLAAVAFTGCTKSYYSEKDEKTIVESGQKLMEEYLTKLPGQTSIKSIYLETGALVGHSIYEGYYLSYCAGGTYECNGKEYDFTVNTQTGEIWDNYSLDKLNEVIKAQLVPYINEYEPEIDFEVNAGTVFYRNVSKDVKVSGNTADTEVYIENKIPEELNFSNNLLDDLKNIPLTEINIYYSCQDNEYCPKSDFLKAYLKDSGNYYNEDDEYLVYKTYTFTYVSRQALENIRLTGAVSEEELKKSNRYASMTFVYSVDNMDYRSEYSAD